ncbi:MAG TPA: ABC transporter ATP-binding protein [Acidimicrobiales bacterium]|nr:ABC transporter ATP-binding protein [Acidimicrobiales bacterium]
MSNDRADAVTPAERESQLSVLRRGWRSSPDLREGARLTLALALAGGAGRVVVPVLVQQILDRGVVSGAVRMHVVVGLAAAATVIITLTALASRATRTRLAIAGERYLAALRTDAFRHIHRLSLATQTEERRGELVARVTSDVETLSQFLSWGGMSWLVNGAVMLAVVCVMAAYDARLALVAVTVVLPMAGVLRLVQKYMSRAYDEVRARNGELLTAVSETVMGAAVVRAYAAHQALRTRSSAAIAGQRRAFIRAGTIGALLFPSGEVFSVLTISAVVVGGVWLGPASGLSAGELVAFVFLVGLFLEPVAEFTEIMDQTQMAVAGWRRVLDVLDTPVELPDPAPDVAVTLPHDAPEIVVEHVSFAYTGAETTRVLHDVDVTIRAGRRVALVGATGSGKTTLAKLLTRLADPTEGRILVGGVDLRDVDPRSLRSTLVMVPQEGFLFDTTIAQNVRFGRPGAGDAEVLAAFDDLGLGPWVDGLAAGIDTPVGERGEHLSVGERQLVALARAHLAGPSCLILDEATSAVDPATEVRLSRAIESLTSGRTTIAIAHRLSTAERADEVLVMDHGRLVERGPHDALVSAGGVYSRLHARWLSATAAIGS